ncbi:MAG: MSHA bioproteinis protein MshG [Candidatus Saganbacteria bacterium]|uniref:MSHA bioproteinis protein MshG n=1 Tax=Candidatus Saganbacteria bacterium TaxID=2575572 RepID=A0A833L0H0_UNCSA|nr:MAG: MSHA bioproteinis protein MshG [Candidatus Saganbacteria bacterium]
MPIFNYKAKDKYGVPIEGIMEAAAASAVASRLSGMGYTPVSIAEEETSALNNLEDFLSKYTSVKTEEMIVFIRQLSVIIGAGVPLLESLEAVYDQVASKRFKKIVLNIRREIEGGSSFSDALAREPKIFPPVFTSMVKAGEKAGILSEVLERLANLLERDYDNLQKIKSATRYPVIVIAALVIAFIIVVTFIIPRFSALYSAFKTELPLPTRILLGINFVIRNYFFAIIAGISVLAYSIKKVLQTERGKTFWDRFALSVPIFGILVSKLSLARFCRMLAAMLKSGIPVVEGLSITKNTVDNRIISNVISNIEEEVIRGGSLSEPMRGSKIFPPIAIQMVAIGEKAGALEGMLEKVADYFDRDADYMIKNLTPLLEPLLILMLAFLVTLLALGVFLPMWDMVKFIKS